MPLTKRWLQNKMYLLLNCMLAVHDGRLIALAVGVCFLTSFAAMHLFRRALATAGSLRLVWLCANGFAAGAGVWSTHFIAILAYSLGMPIGYHYGLTLGSLLIAIVTTGIGFSIAAFFRANNTKAIVASGIVIGGGIALMHYTGMFAVEVAAQLHFSLVLVTISIVTGIIFATLSLVIARHEGWISVLLGAAFFTLAIVSAHFIGMSAASFEADPSVPSNVMALPPTWLAFGIAALIAVVLGMCTVAALSDARFANKLFKQRRLLDAALENMSQGLCMFDSRGNIILFNDRYAEMMGVASNWLRGRSLLDLFKLKNISGNEKTPELLFAQIIANCGKSKTEVVTTPGDRALRISQQPKEGGGWVATFEDVTAWQEAQAKIEHMARHDSLTDLPNRTLFREELSFALRRKTRGNQVAVMFIDLDNFKSVNDTLGHPVGDDLLRQVALRFRGCVRENDTVARLGGDEFAVVQVVENGSKEVANLARRLIEVAAAPYRIEGNDVVLGASIGIAISPADGTNPDHLLQNADLALYRAKSDGRATYRFFETGMDARAQARRLLELDLRAALSRNELCLHYQPIHDLKTGRITSFEALVRWNHPLRGLISPSDFIPLAEETGLIVDIGKWVLQRACEDATHWPDNICIAVNLSPIQFKNGTLVKTVIDAVKASGLNMGRLELEITESALLQECESTLVTLHELRDLGVRISMDDFGTGYSSLSYLRSFPFDKIKIDQSFVRDLADSENSTAIIRAVVGLGKSLNMVTTAEGVETREQLELLRSEGCSEVQGYLFSKPQPIEGVTAMLSAHNKFAA